MKLSNQSCLLLTRLCVLCYRPVLIEKLKCSRHHLHFQIHLDRWRGLRWRDDGGGRQAEMIKRKLQWPPPSLPNTHGQVDGEVEEEGGNIFEALYLTGGKDGKGGKKEMM